MNIQYLDPFSKGLSRMKKALFQPFDLKKWFIVGFTAFLAGILDGPNGGGGGSSGRGNGGDLDFRDIVDFPSDAWVWLTGHLVWFSLIIFVISVIITLIIIFTWLSSRGKFMFLDNVVHDRAQVTKPWYEFRIQGNSLMLWRLAYGFFCFIAVVAVIGLFLITVWSTNEVNFPRNLSAGLIIPFVLLFLGLILSMLYISLLLEDFVVPLMYKHNTKILHAWRMFIPLFMRHLPYFLLYGVLMFFIVILIVICVITFGLFTCCFGFLLLIIPYIGSVVMLPVSYTLRAFSVEFLAQFGPEFSVFPEPEETPAET